MSKQAEIFFTVGVEIAVRWECGGERYLSIETRGKKIMTVGGGGERILLEWRREMQSWFDSDADQKVELKFPAFGIRPKLWSEIEKEKLKLKEKTDAILALPRITNVELQKVAVACAKVVKWNWLTDDASAKHLIKLAKRGPHGRSNRAACLCLRGLLLASSFGKLKNFDGITAALEGK